jgi:hypothetical protein
MECIKKIVLGGRNSYGLSEAVFRYAIRCRTVMSGICLDEEGVFLFNIVNYSTDETRNLPSVYYLSNANSPNCAVFRISDAIFFYGTAITTIR